MAPSTPTSSRPVSVRVTETILRRFSSTEAAEPVVEPPPINLVGADLAGRDLTGANLPGVDLTGANLIGARLAGANLAGAVLKNARLDGAHAAGVDLTGADLTRLSAVDTDLDGARLDGARCFLADLAGAHLEAVTLTGADLRRARLAGTSLRSADLTAADLTEADLTAADLTGATVTETVLRDAVVDRVTLRGLRGHKQADWVGVRTDDADFSGAHLVRRSIHDQNELAEFRAQSLGHEALYRVWWATSDCGRSLLRWVASAELLILAYAVVLAALGVDLGNGVSVLDALYVSTTTFCTAGLATDLVDAGGGVKLVLMAEALTGLAMGAGFVAILVNQSTRR